MIKLRDDKKSQIIDKLQDYCSQELDIELGQFDADFLLDFIIRELGGEFYHQGLYDAQAILEKRLDTINEAIHELEQDV